MPERCIPVQAVMSCDEFACALLGRERLITNATDIAYRIKQAIREVGTSLRCSIGLAQSVICQIQIKHNDKLP